MARVTRLAGIRAERARLARVMSGNTLGILLFVLVLAACEGGLAAAARVASRRERIDAQLTARAGAEVAPRPETRVLADVDAA